MPQLQHQKTNEKPKVAPSANQKPGPVVDGSNQVATSNMSGIETTSDTPLLDGVGEPEKNGKPSTSTGPLDAALSMRGKVTYVDPKHGKGDNKRNFTDSEYEKLVTGSEDMKVASCSPFTYWALENAYKAEHPNSGESLINKEIEGSTTVKDVVNCQSGARRGVKDLDGEKADWEDLILGNVAEKDAWRGKGVAGAISKAGLGVEVAVSDAKPGDLCQTWTTGSTDKGEFKFGGHSTQVHRVHCSGAAWFGVEGAPKLTSVDPSATDFARMVKDGVCDASGAVLKQPLMPLWIDKCEFRIDETTIAGEIGPHTVLKQELIGSHNGGVDADSKTGATNSGVFTREAEDLSTQQNNSKKRGAKRVYLARLNESQWAEYTPASSSTHSIKLEKMPIRPIEPISTGIENQEPMELLPSSVPEADDGKKKRRRKNRKKDAVPTMDPELLKYMF